MLKMLAFTAITAFGAAGLLRRLLIAVLLGCIVSRAMRALVVAAAVAIVATQVYAGVSAPMGTRGCSPAGSRTPDGLEAYITTQQCELTGGGRLQKAPTKSPESYVQPRGDVVSFHLGTNPRAYVELQRKKHRWGPRRGRFMSILTGKLVMQGKHYDLSCTRR